MSTVLALGRYRFRSTRLMRWVGVQLLLACVLWALPAQADKIAAEKLFQEGRSLMEAGQTARACAKFEASMEAERSVGAILNLALCHETLGKTASAWAEYAEAADLARHAGQAERVRGANEAVARLAPLLAKLTIVVDDHSEGLVVSRDQTRVLPAVFGTALPIDPGDHVIAARAPGKQPWTTKVHIPPGPGTASVVVPVLSSATTPPPAAPAPELDSSQPQPEADSADGDGLSGTEIAGITLMSVGAVGLGVGIGAGLVAMGEQQSLDDDLASGSLCPSSSAGCAEAQSRADSDIKPIAHGSTAGLVIGGAALVGGIVLFLLAPDEGQRAAMVLPIVGPSSASLAVTGRF